MKLISIRVRRFRNILDSGDVEILPDVTCLVGKNESGKTALLHALYRLNPTHPNVEFSIPCQYPAWLEKKDRLKGEELEKVKAISATFKLDDDDKDAILETFGDVIVGVDAGFTIAKDYSGNLAYSLNISEQAFVNYIIELINWPYGTKTKVKKLKSIKEIKEYVEAIKSKNDEEHQKAAEAVKNEISNRLGDNTLDQAVWEKLKSLLPRFLYFAEYSTLPYSVDIKKVLSSNPESLNDNELTAKSLLKIAAADEGFLTNADYERRKREVENVANSITDDVLIYWSQNPELRVEPDITQKTVSNEKGKESVVDELKMRIRDNRHSLSLPFDEHSTGFQWFFSFLAAFSEYEYRDEPIIILLDEPALGLHAKAQKDFLRFIEERLAPKNQVIYTTHSPFMVQPEHLEKVKLVEDKGKTEGAKVSADVTATDPDTIFPLQGALGYDLAQNLFIAPHNLVVEGTSDYTYLQVISDYFKSIGNRTALDDRWSIIPVGGVDLVPTFVALLGNHLDVTVLIDSQKGGHQKLSKLVSQDILTANRIITVGFVISKEEADIEDLFDPSEYLELFNEAFNKNLNISELTGNDSIVKKIARALEQGRYNHGVPADNFLKNRDHIIPRLSEETLDRFEKLFKVLNETLPD